MSEPATVLKELKPNNDFFVGIDSDGCVYDNMGIKQRECFCPMMIGYFGLQPVAEAARQCKEFADLFSKTRGSNRHITIARILTELLPSHPMVKQRRFEVPAFKYYCEWVNNPNTMLSNQSMEREIEKAENNQARKEFETALKWSHRVNEMVQEIVRDIPPINNVRKSLEKISSKVDVIVCSSTPCEAIEREWSEHDIAKYMDVVAGQEMGKKAEHLEYATKGKYKKDHVLMIGDAPGDMLAAQTNDALFYPINPGNEDNSWKRFYNEAFDKFINGKYAGEYQKKLIEEYEEYLPEKPRWQRE